MSPDESLKALFHVCISERYWENSTLRSTGNVGLASLQLQLQRHNWTAVYTKTWMYSLIVIHILRVCQCQQQ